MTLDQWTSCCFKAIHTNFRSRNARVFLDQSRHQQHVHTRRNNVRRWIAEVRLAMNPANAQLVAQYVLWRIN